MMGLWLRAASINTIPEAVMENQLKKAHERENYEADRYVERSTIADTDGLWTCADGNAMVSERRVKSTITEQTIQHPTKVKSEFTSTGLLEYHWTVAWLGGQSQLVRPAFHRRDQCADEQIFSAFTRTNLFASTVPCGLDDNPLLSSAMVPAVTNSGLPAVICTRQLPSDAPSPN